MLGGSQLVISHNVEIRAAQVGTVVLDAGQSSRVFYITGGNVSLIGLDITGGKAMVVRCTCLELSSYT